MSSVLLLYPLSLSTKTYTYDMSSNEQQLFAIVLNSLCTWDHCQHQLNHAGGVTGAMKPEV